MSDGLSPFEINRQVREGRERDERMRRDIQLTAQAPNEIHTIVNFGVGVADGEGDRVVVQIIKPDGEQVHLVFNPDARRALVRDLAAKDPDGGEGSGSVLELPRG